MLPPPNALTRILNSSTRPCSCFHYYSADKTKLLPGIGATSDSHTFGKSLDFRTTSSQFHCNRPKGMEYSGSHDAMTPSRCRTSICCLVTIKHAIVPLRTREFIQSIVVTERLAMPVWSYLMGVPFSSIPQDISKLAVVWRRSSSSASKRFKGKAASNHSVIFRGLW
eukprot:scaffold1136_cov146-Cylindrotheca_fusiformis.AAC.24